MAIQRLIPVIIALSAVVALSGCGSTKRALGIEKTVPDEFAVLNRGPLVMPPDYNLRPPVPGAARPQEETPDEEARSALLGSAKLQQLRNQGMSRGEVALLAKAGADQQGPAIRETLDKEASMFAKESNSFTDKLLFWRSSDAIGGTELDPKAEHKRLARNQAEGKKPSEGPLPVITKGGGSKVLGVF